MQPNHVFQNGANFKRPGFHVLDFPNFYTVKTNVFVTNEIHPNYQAQDMGNAGYLKLACFKMTCFEMRGQVADTSDLCEQDVVAIL